MKKETLSLIKDIDNNNSKSDISFYNPKTERRTRKISISSMENEINELDSYIGELYKIYKETKKARLRKEKSEQDLINHINFLALEEKKLRDELTNKSKIKFKNYYKTTYNTNTNSPRGKNDKTKSVENLLENKLNEDLNNLTEAKIQNEKSKIKFKKYNNNKIYKNNNHNSLELESKEIKKNDKIKNIIYNKNNIIQLTQTHPSSILFK